ncbi:hypothetical protein BHM03_00038454, partial [Ensete ventricosum]
MWAKVNCQRSKHNRRWRRPYDMLAEATHGEIVVERGKEATTSLAGLNYLKTKAPVRNEVDSEKYHNAVE